MGVFLTLLVLAVVNRGTLIYNTGPQVSELMETVDAINSNVGAVSTNLDTLAGRVEGIQSQTDGMVGDVAAAREELSSQSESVRQLSDSVAVLDLSRQRFDVFTDALTGALSEMSRIGAGEAAQAETETAAPVAEVETVAEGDAGAAAGAESPTAEAATAEAAAGSDEGASVEAAVEVTPSADVAGDAVAVLLFADADGDGVKGEDEATLAGISLSLVDGAGELVATEIGTETGVLFSGLAAGDYTIVHEDGTEIVAVTVVEDAEEGQLVQVPVTE